MVYSLLTMLLKVPNVGHPSSWPGQLGHIIWTVLAVQRQQKNSNMHETAAHKRRHRTSQSALFCLFYLLRADLVMFLYTMLHCVKVGRQGQHTYELTLWKDGATYGAHHVIWVIRLIANAFWMHPDVWLQLWKPSNNENVKHTLRKFNTGYSIW